MEHWIQQETLKCLFACRVCLFSFSSRLLYIALLLQLLHWMLTLEVTNFNSNGVKAENPCGVFCC